MLSPAWRVEVDQVREGFEWSILHRSQEATFLDAAAEPKPVSQMQQKNPARKPAARYLSEIKSALSVLKLKYVIRTTPAHDGNQENLEETRHQVAACVRSTMMSCMHTAQCNNIRSALTQAQTFFVQDMQLRHP